MLHISSGMRWSSIAVALLASVAAVIGCAGGVSVAEWEGPGGKLKIHSPQPSVNAWQVTVPADRCWELIFTNQSGTVLSTETHQGPAAGFIPVGAVKWEIIEKDCPPPDDVNSSYDFIKGHSGLVLNTTQRYSRITVDEMSEALATAKANTILTGGAGTALPTGVHVYALLDVTTDGTNVVFTSSLPLRFDTYKIKVNGTVVADAATNTNATATAAGNGWVTITSTVAVGDLPANATVEFEQSARGFDRPVVSTIQL